MNSIFLFCLIFNLSAQKNDYPDSLIKIFVGKKAKVAEALTPQLFGYELFQSTYTLLPPEYGITGPEYVLGVGDSLIVTFTGKFEERQEVYIERDGSIYLSKLGIYNVVGMKLANVEKLLKSEVERKFTGVNITVTTGRIKLMNIYVLGEVQRPGAYVMSSLATSIQALLQAGGPKPTGSLRKIFIKRGNKNISKIDFYDFLIKGEKTGDIRLENNDIIFVSVSGPKITIIGSVKRPAIYEVEDNLKLSDLINLAGGLTPEADLSKVYMVRISQQEKKVVQNFQFKDWNDLVNSKDNVLLKDGDFIRIGSILEEKFNFVKVVGNVLNPGEYEWKEGMKVSDAVNIAGGVLTDTYFERGEIHRFLSETSTQLIPFNLNDLVKGDKKKDLKLENWDTVRIYSFAEVFPGASVEITGEVNRPGKYTFRPGMRLTDLIFVAGYLTDYASYEGAELLRRDYLKGEYRVFPIDLKNVIVNYDPNFDIELQKDDKIDIKPQMIFLKDKSIEINGEVRFPGKYYLKEMNEKISSLIERAGGFTKEAYPEGCIITRKNKLERAGKVEELIPETIKEKEVEELIPETIKEKEKEKEFRRFSLDLSKIFENPDDENNISLEDKDEIFIPRKSDWVMVDGAVYDPKIIPYEKGKSFRYYIKRCGGPNKFSDFKALHVKKSNGKTESRYTGFSKILPGDVIVVPYKTPK